jgi:hypothetical protein
MSIRRLGNAVRRLAAGRRFGKRCPGCDYPCTAEALGRLRDEWVIALNEQVSAEVPATEEVDIADSCRRCGASVVPLLDLSLEAVVAALQRAERRGTTTDGKQA